MARYFDARLADIVGQAVKQANFSFSTSKMDDEDCQVRITYWGNFPVHVERMAEYRERYEVPIERALVSEGVINAKLSRTKLDGSTRFILAVLLEKQNDRRRE